MKNLNIINDSVVYLEIYAENPEEVEEPISRATGFLWQNNSNLYLVTNWHVVTGRSQDTGKQLGTKPKYIKLHSFQGYSHIINLYGENDSPLWNQSKNKNIQNVAEIDIAILPIEKSLRTNDLKPLNITLTENSTRNDVIFEATMPLYIVGYPIKQNISQIDDPSWVTTCVANPPQSDKFFFLTNGYPFSGMSGAPVFWVFPNRPIKLSNGGTMTNASTGTFIQFAGIYSGRLYESSAKEQIAPIARIWKSELIETVFP